MRILIKILILFITLGIISACAESLSWNGLYLYEASLGDTVGGDVVTINYKLIVAPNKCEISMDGFQISETIICKAIETGDKLNVQFQSYDNGSVKNKYGINIYKVNAELLQLNRKDVLLTTWGELLPDEKMAKTGKYFIKQSPSKKI